MPPISSLELNQLALAAKEHASERGVTQQFLKRICPYVRHVCARTVARIPRHQFGFDDEDLAQIVWTKTWESLHLFDATKASFTTWVWTIAKHAWLDLTRSRPDEKEAEQLDERLAVEASAVDDQVDAGTSLEFLEKKVPAQHFEVVVLNGAGCTAAEIANIQGVSLEAAKTRIRVARRHVFAVWAVGGCAAVA